MIPSEAGNDTSGWNDPGHAAQYLDRIGTLPPRIAGERALCQILPSEPLTLLDLGCGDGRLTALALEARPTLKRAVAVDRSPPMLERARERFHADHRVEVRPWDLTDSIEPLGPFDLIVSGLAVHHLEHDRKRRLFEEIASQLPSGGLFANLEVTASTTPELHAEFLRAIGRSADDPEDRLVDAETQAMWMRHAGLADVHCLWRWRSFALLVGRGRS